VWCSLKKSEVNIVKLYTTVKFPSFTKLRFSNIFHHHLEESKFCMCKSKLLYFRYRMFILYSLLANPLSELLVI